MKRIYESLFVLLCVAFAGCEQLPPDVLQAEPDYADVELSSGEVVISEEGGTKTIFVASNRVEWNIEEKSDWVDVSIEGNALTLYVEENTSMEGRLAVVDVVAGVEPDVAKARLKVYQAGYATTDLSAEGTANCYIAHTNASYLFDASVKGNGKRDGNSRYKELVGVEIEGAAYASLAWEATYDGDKTRSTKIINGEPIYSAEEGAIYFTTGQSEGNALVTLHNAAGDIVWSWHIWVTNDELSTSQGNGLEWMDRNLGALNNTIGDVANRGMLYQWGRKEPFLPSPAEYRYVPEHKYDDEGYSLETEEEYYALEAEIVAAREVLNVCNEQVGNGFAKWQTVGYVAPVALAAPGNIEYAIQHPTTILGCRVDIPIGEYVFDWYLQQDLEGIDGYLQQSASNLWGDSKMSEDYKTIFDPCPVGYVVPPVGAFTEIPAGYAASSFARGEWTECDYGWTWTKGNGDYFPSAGNLDVSGLMGETSERPLYWTSESFGSGAQGFGKAAMLFEAFDDLYYGIYPILDPEEAASWYSYGAKCMAASVRCVKEK